MLIRLIGMGVYSLIFQKGKLLETFQLYDKTDRNDLLLERQTVPVYQNGQQEQKFVKEHIWILQKLKQIYRKKGI